jgi:hypothetical protein
MTAEWEFCFEVCPRQPTNQPAQAVFGLGGHSTLPYVTQRRSPVTCSLYSSSTRIHALQPNNIRRTAMFFQATSTRTSTMAVLPPIELEELLKF